MISTYSDLSRERFAEELAAASDETLRGLAYSYIGLCRRHGAGPDSSWRWKVDMIADECHGRGRSDILDDEYAAVDGELLMARQDLSGAAVA